MTELSTPSDGASDVLTAIIQCNQHPIQDKREEAYFVSLFLYVLVGEKTT